MVGKFRRGLVVLLAMQVATGCGYIKSLFPDKERDYQFRTEIPELIVPEDLKGKTLPERTPEEVAAAAVAAAESNAERETEPADVQEGQASATQSEPDSATKAEDKPMLPVASSNPSVSSLQIDQPQMQAWRLVARALSRQKMEIVERNIDKGYFYVNYDPHAIKPTDDSIWDEFTFFFGEDPSNEKEYRITLQQLAPQVTEVTIQDSSGTTLSNDVATSLLKLITDGINQSMPEKSPDQLDESAAQEATEKKEENAEDQVVPEKPQDPATEQGSTDKTQDSPTESEPAP